MKCFLANFEHAYHKATKQGLQLDDSVLVYMLLASCAFEEKERNGDVYNSGCELC